MKSRHQNSKRISMSNVLLKRTSDSRIFKTRRDRWSKLLQYLLGLVHSETTSDRWSKLLQYLLGLVHSETNSDRWSKLPADALGLVVDRIISAKDFIVFRAVCKDWRSAIPQSYWTPVAPWLLARRYKTPVVVLKAVSSLGPPNNSLSSLFETELCWRFWGSFTGWILGQHTSDNRLRLINPLTKAIIDLPQLNRPIRKGLIYRTPASDSRNPTIGVMAIFHGLNGIAMIDNEFKDWTFWADMKGVRKSDFVDVVWYKDNLVALRANGAVVFFNEGTVVRSLDPKPVLVKKYSATYLVESSGDLLIVLAPVDCSKYFVYRLNLDTGDWIQVTDLGKHSLFVGNSYSMSCWISDDEMGDSWRPDCIYNATYSSTHSGELSFYSITEETMEVHDLGPVTDLIKCSDFIWYKPAVGFN